MGIFSKKGDSEALAKLASAPEPYRGIGERLHAIIRQTAPELEPVVRWGIPFYVRDGVDVCYIKSGKGFLVFGFDETINPAFSDSENMHPVVWNVTSLDDETEERITALIKKAVS